MSLRERREVVSLYRSAGSGTERGVLFSVVRVAGSSYRQPGARMLVLPDGRTAGTISGGCLEADLLRRAAWTVRAGAVVERFSTAFDDTAEIPYGLGCGGEVDVLAEPLEAPEAAALLEATAATLQGGRRTVVTVLPGQKQLPGRGASALGRLVLDAEGAVLFESDGLTPALVEQLQGRARRSDAHGWMETAGQTLFVEQMQPVQRLLIFGAGEDARPLSRLAQEMGWLPVVVDTRAQRVTEQRFPGAACVIASSTTEIAVLSSDAAVLMTHSYQQDRQLLSELLVQPLAYLGLLGARHRSSLLLQEASALAGVSLAQAVALTHAPIGLELGGEGPEAVGLAIVAEIQLALSGRPGDEAAVSRRLWLPEVERLLADGPSAATYQACGIATADEPVLQ